MEQLYFDIRHQLNDILRCCDVEYLFSEIKIIKERKIINLNKNIKKLNKISDMNFKDTILKYDALYLMFENYTIFEKNELKTFCDEESIIMVNKLTTCINILYEYKDDMILESIFNLTKIFKIFMERKLPNFYGINNSDIEKIDSIIIHSLYNKIKNDLTYLTNTIKNIDNSIDISNIPVKRIIRGDESIIKYIKFFEKQYMLESKYDEDFKNYCNVFNILEQQFVYNEEFYESICKKNY